MPFNDVNTPRPTHNGAYILCYSPLCGSAASSTYVAVKCFGECRTFNKSSLATVITGCL